MEKSVSLRYHIQELGSETLTLPRSLDEPREVEDLDWYESPTIDAFRVAGSVR